MAGTLAIIGRAAHTVLRAAPVTVLQDRSGNHRVTVEIPAGTRLLTVETDGSWSFQLD